ncbi:MAG TPA: hypothetical protein VIZ30_00210, partial [Pseudomonadales bacterium]
MIGLVAAASVFLGGTGSAAHFAVLDHSGWVERAVAERVIRQDVAILVAALSQMPADSRPPPLVELGALEDPRERAMLVEEASNLLTQLRHGSLHIEVPRTPAERVARWAHLRPAAVARLAPDSSLAKYRYVATPGMDKAALNALLADDTLLGYFVIPENPVADG